MSAALLQPECRVRYLLAGESEPRAATLDADGRLQLDGARDHLSLSLELRDETYRLTLNARQLLCVVDSSVTLHHRFRAHERVFLNGYQSWTDSRELSPTARMRGLSHVPRFLVDRYVLDGSGDYRFTDYPNRRGQLHGYSYGYIRNGANLTLVASLSEDRGFTLMHTDAHAGTWALSQETGDEPICAGGACTLCDFAIIEGSEREVFDRWFALMGTSPLEALPLVGYTSWYRHYADIDEAALEADLEKTACFLQGVDMGGLSPLFQIDDGYTKVGDWLDVDRGRFPRGLAPLAGRIREEGLLPGLWLAPFVCEKDSKLFSERLDWIATDRQGLPVTIGCNWSGGYALDTRNPEVRDYVTRVIRTVTREWGFSLLKLDFLFAACMVPHDGLNRGQLMSDAIDLLCEAAGPQVQFLCCGVPLASVFGHTEYCRVGCDVGLDWDDKPYMRLIHRERVSTRNNRGNTVGRAHLNGRAFVCDPDVFFLRDDVKLSAQQRLEQLRIDAEYGGVLLTSDDMSTWGAPEREAYFAAIEVLRGKNRW